MFGMKKANGELSPSDIETVIGRNTEIKGEILGAGNMRVDGLVRGEVSIEGDAVIGEQGRIVGNVCARNVLISGEVKGNITAANKLEILSSGKLFGDAKATVLGISEGAVFKGNSDMESVAKSEPVDMK